MPNHTPPQLFLVDGYALIYRAFFALISRPLRTSRGENTSAAWGVVNFLCGSVETYRPDYLVWVHDAGVSFRPERYPAVQGDAREARSRSCRPISTARWSGSASSSTPSAFPSSRCRATRPTTSSARWPSGRPPRGLPGRDRLRRQGFLPADRAADLAAQPGAGRPRRRSTRCGSTRPMRRSDSACRPAGSPTTSRWSATAPTTFRA